MSTRKETIVVLDDEVQIVRLLTKILQSKGYATITAKDGEDALDQVIAASPDLLLVDLMMPKMDGFEVVERVRAFSQLPIIILTACGQDQEKIRGLDLGADDYLTKPFNLEELTARVRAVLRRSKQNGFTNVPEQAIVTIGELCIDFAANQVTVGGRDISLTSVEYRLLAMLARNPGRIITQDTLLKDVWGPTYGGEIHLLQVGINRLRRKLELDVRHPQYIMTRVGIGYFLASPSPAAPKQVA